MEKIQEVKGIGYFRDAAFLSDNHLLLIDDAATLWEIHLSSDPFVNSPKQIIRGGILLRPIAKALRQYLNFWMKPAGGAYPRLAVCPEKNLVVVNSHDFVCLAYSLNSRSTSEIVFGWGQYYPTLEFSPGGDFFVANVEGNLLVWDPTNWEFFEIEGEFKGSVFHSSETRLLVLSDANEIGWFNFSKGSLEPQYSALGSIEEVGLDVRLEINTSGNECVVIWGEGTTSWWALDPLEKIDPKAQLLSKIIQPLQNKRWLAYYANSPSLEIINLDTKELLPHAFPADALIRFSPSGQYAVTIRSDNFSDNPYPVNASSSPTEVNVWRL